MAERIYNFETSFGKTHVFHIEQNYDEVVPVMVSFSSHFSAEFNGSGPGSTLSVSLEDIYTERSEYDQSRLLCCAYIHETNNGEVELRLCLAFNYNNTANTAGRFWFLGEQTVNGTTTQFDGDQATYDISWKLSARYDGEWHFNSPNIPIFATQEDWENFVVTEDFTGCLNSGNDYSVETTQTYFIYNQYGNGNLLYGSVTPSGSQSWHSMRIKANKTPVLYFTGNGFEMRLSASSVVASKATTGPGYTIDYIPEEDWPEKRLDYTGPFYGDVSHYADANGTLPDAGTYTYGFTFSTNCYIFKNQEEAEEAEQSGDYEKAVNAYDLDNKYYSPPVVGDPEAATTFGSGAVTSPFVSTYLCSRNDVLNVANAFYSNDASIIDNIKKGLELFGAEPFQALCGLKYFPCSLANIVTAASQNYIYFGSYKHEGVTVDKVVNLNSGGYIDAGTVTLTPVQKSYRSFEPYCGLTVYLPYIGWQKLNIADYFGKTVNIRYYIDIYTGACAAALVANGVMIDYFTGTIGVELPVTGQMLSQYANSALNSILGTAGGTVGGALSGAMMGSAIPGVGTAVGAVAGAAVVGGASLAAGVFKMSQKGTPKDSNHTKGNFTSSIGSYLPQYVIFRFDVHDLIIPDLLTDLYGRPSAASGRVSNFSGFLQADTVKLNTYGMTEEEANEITSLLKEGIFV